jgi:DMSO/TMAO reductase YedYZ heme-binding membrane subunit
MVAVTFLAATLSIGPIRVLRGHRPAVHLPWRRTLGVTGSLLAVSHLLVAMNVHGRLWRPWDQFFTGRPSLDDPLIVLHDTRGVANYLGLTAASALVALALLSRNSWIRRLGAVRWKMAQRTLYVVFAVVALHAVLYWRVERRLAIHQFLVLTPIVAATGLQVAAAIASTVRARRRAPVPADARPNGAKG